MEKRLSITLALVLLLRFVVLAQSSDWQLQPIPVQSRWAKEVSPTNALPAYPRPQMTRPDWVNLNGLWDYAITAKDASRPTQYTGKILVPYPLESALSGVKKSLQPNQNLWYHRIFSRPELKGGERVLLHFGAVDWQTTVSVNGQKVGMHTGGYTEFSFDITKSLHRGDNELTIRVYDPTDEGIGPHGKQVLNPQNIYYTPTSGIWQTVWMEVVPGNHIESLKITPNVDSGFVAVTVRAAGNEKVRLSGEGIDASGRSNEVIRIPMVNAHLWSPADPYRYHLTVKMGSDEVGSYFGMRKISVAKDEKGVDRIFLNNKPYYNLGTLDQGFWPDGLYTAPTDEALAFDIKAIKAMGFNTIRKHIKVEPARWYYYADSLGMLVWQDMVNPNQSLPEGSKPEFEKESAEILRQLHNSPAIVVWVLFNERWGQYDQERLTKWIKDTDPSRIVNGHTGELLYVNEQLRAPADNPYVGADMTDVHSYPDPMMPIRQEGKAQVLGEFGGIGVFIPDHQWNSSSAWGYIQERPASLASKYTIMTQHLQLMQREGLSGSIYTQPFDVEGEQNGLMTYDREVVKIPFEELRQINGRLNPDMGIIPDVTASNPDLTEPGVTYSKMLQEYIDGRHDAEFLKKLAMRATQVGDKLGEREVGTEYVASYLMSLGAPLSEEQIRSVAQFTQSTKDTGFQLMQANADAFRQVLGDRAYTVAIMNMIYKGEIEPEVASHPSPDWAAIGMKIKPYGPAGEEMLLRAETIQYLNNQDWAHYVPVAKAYLDKYGGNVRDSEKKMLEGQIKDHESGGPGGSK